MMNTHIASQGAEHLETAKIRLAAIWFLGGVITYILLYVGFGVFGLLDFAFLSPQRMERHWMTGGVVTQHIRWLHFAVWAPVYLAGLYAMINAAIAARIVHQGQWFTDRFGKALFHVGLGISISACLDLVATFARRPILSMANPNGQLDVFWRFRSEELGLIFCGVGFCALGWLMRQAAIIAQENDSFV